MLYQVEVTWTETGSVPIEASDLDSAIEKAKETMDDLALPEGEYLEESFQIDEDTTRLLHKIFHRINKRRFDRCMAQTKNQRGVDGKNSGSNQS